MISDSSLELLGNTKFISNSALYEGGALATNSLYQGISQFNISVSGGVSFINNSAGEKGGAIYSGFYPPNIEEGVTFEGNAAQYGSNFGSFPFEIGISELGEGELYEVKSGYEVKGLMFYLHDING